MPKLLSRSLIIAALLTGAAQAQDPNASQAQDLANCAGAVGAFASIHPLRFMMPPGAPFATEPGWPAVMGAILAQLNLVEGLQGMTGRHAADEARRYWSDRPRAEQQTAAQDCRARFAPG